MVLVLSSHEPGTQHDGSEGELYDTKSDPLQWHNLWDDPERRALRDQLVADLYDHLPPARDPELEREADV